MKMLEKLFKIILKIFKQLLSSQLKDQNIQQIFSGIITQAEKNSLLEEINHYQYDIHLKQARVVA